MYTGEIDFPSFILYIIVGSVGMLLLNSAQKRNITVSNINSSNSNTSLNCYYIIFLGFFTTFAALRKVDHNLGGGDALAYINRFLTALQTTAADYERSGTSEPLFHMYLQVIRYFVQDYKVFFAFSYGIIVYSYCVFHQYYTQNSNISKIPFVLVIWPYLKSFCTLRSSMAIAVFLLALTMIEKRKYLSLVLLISTVLIHRMSVVFVLIWPFYHLYKNRISKFSGRKVIKFVVVYVFATIVAARFLQFTILQNGWLVSTDAWYLKQSSNQSLISRWPMFIAQLTLLIMMWIYQDEIKKTPRYESIKIFCIFDFVMVPATLVLGLWRANEYLYIARLIMWGNILPVIENSFKQKKYLAIFLEYSLFISWLCFRIYSEWDELKILPYLLWFQ